jgi:CrcB protein
MRVGQDVLVSVPLEPDAGAAAPTSPFEDVRRPRQPAIRWDVLLAVFVGGCVGGWARHAINTTWPTGSGRFPWATFFVNVAGAFVLAVVIVVAVELVSSRYLRPVLGTGFCGAFTTFSAIVVTVDELLAHHHPGAAIAYLAASIGGGLAAAGLGLAGARVVVAMRHRAERTVS